MRKITNEVLKNIEKEQYYSAENFARDVKDWITAIKTGSMLCIIHKKTRDELSQKIPAYR